MSQEGAEYLAAHGKKWDEIVKYYYTGVSISDYIWT
jgi:peptidoglycan hydrolase-like amidase